MPKSIALDFLAKVDLDFRIAPDYLLAEQRDICPVTTTTCYTWINNSGEVETQLHRSLSKPLGFKR